MCIPDFMLYFHEEIAKRYLKPLFKKRLENLIKKKRSLLCLGLDCDLEKIPRFLLQDKDPLLHFNREIIGATREYVIAYKLNVAFYESLGLSGWRLFEKTLELIPADTLVIADAKRGDIGNTSRKYAELYFHFYRCDAITVSPYLGYDSIQPFLEFDDRGIFTLCLTSNPGSLDFQYLTVENEPLYLKIARKVSEWNLDYGNCGLVVGATHPEDMGSIREVASQLPFLIPGIGAQGGNLQMAIQYGTDESGGNALINVSRSILYASSEKNFGEVAHQMTVKLNNEIDRFRKSKKNP